MNYLTKQAILANDFLGLGQSFNEGASVSFFGIIRKNSLGREVKFLEYEAYEPMAERVIDALMDQAVRRWPLLDVKVLHRLGRIEIGEIAVAIEVRSEHRDEAYQASRFLIDEIKHEVPIWKKEVFVNGESEWSRCQHVDVEQKEQVETEKKARMHEIVNEMI